MKDRSGQAGQLAPLKALLLACPEHYDSSELAIHFLQVEDMELFKTIEFDEDIIVPTNNRGLGLHLRFETLTQEDE